MTNWNIFLIFPRKQFPGKNKKNISLSSPEFAQRVVKVKAESWMLHATQDLGGYISIVLFQNAFMHYKFLSRTQITAIELLRQFVVHVWPWFSFLWHKLFWGYIRVRLFQIQQFSEPDTNAAQCDLDFHNRSSFLYLTHDLFRTYVNKIISDQSYICQTPTNVIALYRQFKQSLNMTLTFKVGSQVLYTTHDLIVAYMKDCHNIILVICMKLQCDVHLQGREPGIEHITKCVIFLWSIFVSNYFKIPSYTAKLYIIDPYCSHSCKSILYKIQMWPWFSR